MNEYNKIYLEEVIEERLLNKEKIFELLLEYFDTNRIAYALLSQCPNLGEEGDIDFVISQKHFNEIFEIINKFCQKNKLLPVQIRKHEVTASLFILSYYNKQKQRLDYVKIDFYSDYIKRGRFYLASDELLNNRTYKYDGNYWKLNDTYFFIYYLIKKIDKRSVTFAQFFELFKCWLNAKPTIIEKLKKFFNEECIKVITKAFEEKDLTHLNEHINYLRKTLHKKKSRSVVNLFHSKLQLIRSIVKPNGVVVAVLGRDGSGKSTFVNEMIGSMKPYFRKTERFHTFAGVLYRRGMFSANPQRQTDFQQILPQSLFKKNTGKRNGFSHHTPHNQKLKSRAASFLKLVIFFSEALVGYWVKIFPRRVKGHFILFDRYFIDVLADPVRYRIKTKGFFIRAFHFLLPKPDIWILIDLPTDVLLKRKQELDYETAEKLRRQYLSLPRFLSNSIVINNEGEIKDTVHQASSFILNYMHKQFF